MLTRAACAGQRQDSRAEDEADGGDGGDAGGSGGEGGGEGQCGGAGPTNKIRVTRETGSRRPALRHRHGARACKVHSTVLVPVR